MTTTVGCPRAPVPPRAPSLGAQSRGAGRKGAARAREAGTCGWAERQAPRRLPVP